MDGSTLLRELRGVLNEPASSSFLTDRDSYGYLYDAAMAAAARISSPTTSQSISTVASQTNYNLNPNFLQLYVRDTSNNLVIRYTTSAGQVSDPVFYSFEHIYMARRTTAIAKPDSFTLVEAPEKSQVTGTATSAGALSNGETILTDSVANFTTSEVSPGDVIHNTTDGSSGYVLAVNSTTTLRTALFDGTNNYWSSSNAYIIIPQASYQVRLDPPPLNSGDTILIQYVQRPGPVFSPYRSYNLPSSIKEAIVAYAGWKYKYRDREPGLGDPLYALWESRTREHNARINTNRQRLRMIVDFNKTASRDRSLR